MNSGDELWKYIESKKICSNVVAVIATGRWRDTNPFWLKARHENRVQYPSIYTRICMPSCGRKLYSSLILFLFRFLSCN